MRALIVGRAVTRPLLRAQQMFCWRRREFCFSRQND
jgi:hypothetical protein